MPAAGVCINKQWSQASRNRCGVWPAVSIIERRGGGQWAVTEACRKQRGVVPCVAVQVVAWEVCPVGQCVGSQWCALCWDPR